MSNDKYDDEADHDLDADLGDEYFDDLDDHDSSSDVDGDWDDMEEDSYEQPKKKKKSLSNVIIIAVAVLAGLVFLVFKFGGSSQSTETPPAVEIAAEEVPTPIADVQDVIPAVSPAETAPASTESDPMTQALQSGNGVLPAEIPSQTEQGMEVTQPEASSPLTPMPAEPEVAQNGEPPLLQEVPSQEPPSLMTSPDVAPEPIPAPVPTGPAPVVDQEQPPMLQPVSDFPSADMIKKVETPAPVPAPTPEPVAVAEEAPVPTPVAAEPAPVVEQQGSAELQQALDRVKQLEDSADKNDQVIQGYEDEVASLKDRIAELEGKLGEASKKAASSDDKKAAPVKAVEPEVESEAPKKSDSANEETPVRWVLKGAQPGRALLAAYDQKQADVRTVAVGDQVPGLGTILSIEKGQSGWVVLGTTGKVTQ